MGKAQKVSIQVLLEATSQTAAIVEAAQQKARDHGAKPFVERVQMLRETFGLNFQWVENIENALSHYSKIRNTAVYDEGVFEIFLDETWRVTHRQRTCEHRPTRLTNEVSELAVDTYEHIWSLIATAVLEQVLKVNLDNDLGQEINRRLKITGQRSGLLGGVDHI
jgi:hypothetical protein